MATQRVAQTEAQRTAATVSPATQAFAERRIAQAAAQRRAEEVADIERQVAALPAWDTNGRLKLAAKLAVAKRYDVDHPRG
jgi:hypothetical protein